MIVIALIWIAVAAVGVLALFVGRAAYRLHMENDRVLGPCVIHRLLRRR